MNKKTRERMNAIISNLTRLENKIDKATIISRLRDRPITEPAQNGSLYPRMIYTREYDLRDVVELILEKLSVDIEFKPATSKTFTLESIQKNPVKPKTKGGKK